MLLVLALIITSAITLMFAISSFRKSHEISFFAGHNVWEFLLGILAAIVSFKTRYNNKICIAVLLVTFSAFLTINLAYTNSYNNLIYGLLAATSVIFVTQIENRFFLKIPRLLVIVGDASYITYLIHVPVREILFRHIALTACNIVIYLLLVQLLSIGIHLWYEKKIIQKLNAVAKRLIFTKATGKT